jgi:hypothetical protein
MNIRMIVTDLENDNRYNAKTRRLLKIFTDKGMQANSGGPRPPVLSCNRDYFENNARVTK